MGLLRGLLAHLMLSEALLRASRGRLGALLERFKAVVGPSRERLRPSWADLGPSWGAPGLSWGYLGGLLGRLGRSELQTGENLKIIQTLNENQCFLASSGSLGGPLGALLEASLGVWGLLGASWAVLEGSWPV